MAMRLILLIIKVMLVFSEIKAEQVSNETVSYSEWDIINQPPSNDSNRVPTHSEIHFHSNQYSNESTSLHMNFESSNFTEQNSNDTADLFNVNLSPKEKRQRLLTELTNALVPDKDGSKIQILTDPEHPYINATTGQCFNHVITSFSRACIVSKAFGGWRMIKGFFAVACKALELKRQRITECINRVCKKYPYLKI